VKTEATGIIELVRSGALLLSFAGVIVTAEERTVIAAGITGLALAVSAGLAVWNRLKVFSKATTERLVQRAAQTGVPAVGEPPKGAAG
jgi:uncharacterized membrane protein